ncbi:MAG TPA: alpha/beta hydrolase [Actinomycetota bacterium]|nr:alpha/beta hydrolase [Actinomycetota bacterium]
MNERQRGGISYTDTGDPGEPVVVLLRGGAESAPWADLIAMLSPWMRVIVPEPPAEVPPEDHARRVRALLEDLGVSRWAIVGEGEGGPVAQRLALDGAVDAMILLSSSALEDADEALASLGIPVLAVYGEEDANLPATALAERFAEVLPMASVAVLPARGHALLEEAPETVAPLVFQWLRSQYLKVAHAHEGGPVVVTLGRRPPEDA